MSAHFGGEAARALLRVTQRAVAWQRATDASTAVAIAVVDFLYGPFARIPTAFRQRCGSHSRPTGRHAAVSTGAAAQS
jgi:hypothetical protein